MHLVPLRRGVRTGALVALAVLAGAAWSSMTEAAKRFTYPEARRGDVVDTYWGVKVPDPYRWLEDPDSPETLAWVEAENRLTREYIDGYPDREAIEARIRKLWNYPRVSLPERHGSRYFFARNDGLQNQAVVYVQESLDAEPRVLIDPNTLSEDGTVALSNQSYSEDGRYLAYGLSESGSDWQTIHVRDVDTGRDLDDVLRWCRFSGIAWKGDASGFWYNRFPAEGEVPESERNMHSKVYFHRLGTPQDDDALVYYDAEHPELGYFPITTDGGEWLLVWVWHGTDPRNGILFRRADDEGPLRRLVAHDVAKFSPVGAVGSTVYFETDLDAPRGRIVAVDLEHPERENWREVVPQGDDVIDFVSLVHDRLVIAYLHDAHHRLTIWSREGTFEREIELPGIGSIAGLSGRREDSEMFYGFTSFTYPTTAFRYDFQTGGSSVFHAPEIDFDPSLYVTKQVFYRSKDGTRVPMFITHRRDLELDGNRPTWLYGYGGFNISLTPGFRVSRLLWLEQGGVYAVANLRGGNEYGEQWHQQGILDRKQNVFDDFIAAAEYLIDEGYTNRKRLVINGGSNGGLLVAACMTQRPDLFGAVVCQVPVIDMLRYHKFTVGRYWVSDYGNAEESEEAFRYLYAYSPLHNVRKGTVYPPTLITTADTDDRVVPAHAKKFAATLQWADAGDNPILIRIETKAGHGAGKPTSKLIEEVADIYAFIYRTFGLRLDES